MRDLLEEDESNPFTKCSTESERESIRQKVDETLHWMNEDGDTAQLLDLRNKIESLESVSYLPHIACSKLTPMQTS